MEENKGTKKDRIVVVGAGIVDVLVNPVEPEVFVKGSVPVDHIKISTGGDALNEAVILARIRGGLPGNSEKNSGISYFSAGENIGTFSKISAMENERTDSKVSLISVIGEDDAGNSVMSRCHQEGIDTSFVVVDKEMDTAVNVVMIQKDGSRSFFTNPKSSLRKLALEHIPEKFPEDAGILCLASIFVSPLLGNEELAEIFRRAKAQGMLVCADMTKCKNQEKVSDMKEAFSYVDYLFANEEEAAMVTGKSSREEMAEEFFRCGVKHVMIKCGGEGCHVKCGEWEKNFPAVAGVNCLDTTGAGDSFAAGFACALSEGKSLEDCVRWGNACGSLTVEAVGACEGIWNREQVLRRLE